MADLILMRFPRARPLVRAVLTSLFLTSLAGCAPALFVSTYPDRTLYPEPPRNAVTFWGHACVYVDVGGYGIVTDPVFGKRYSPFNGRQIPTPPATSYDQTNVILISHAHQDHLQPKTLRLFPRTALILCPPPCVEYVRGLGREYRVMRPGDTFAFPGGTIIAVVADHAGERWSSKDRPDGGALGYVIRTPGLTLYYSGDSKFFEGFRQVGRTFAPDLAILNVNHHLTPPDAWRATEALGFPRVIASHTGAYGGVAGRHGRKWHDEFLKKAGTLGIPLRVGESIALDDIPSRGAAAVGAAPGTVPVTPSERPPARR